MANSILAPIQQLQTSTGDPAVGYLLFVYVAGTTTKLNTYPTAADADAATNANSNPVELNARGEPTTGGMWVPDSVTTLKMVLALPDDTDPPTSPIRTQDNFYLGASLAILNETDDPDQGDALVGIKRILTGATATTLHDYIERLAVSPDDFGAVGDGVADDTAEFQSAADEHLGVIVLTPGKTYRLTSSITLGSNTTIMADGATVEVEEFNDYAFSCSGDSTARVRVVGGTWNLNGSHGFFIRGMAACTFEDDFQLNQKAVVSVSVTAITQANPGVVTYTGDDPTNGDLIRFHDVGGMVELNAESSAASAPRIYTVANVDTVNNTFEIQDEDGVDVDTSAYTLYTSGGLVYRHTIGIHIVNSFNVNLSDQFNIHGYRLGSGDRPYLGEGVRVETDTGDGWTVVNNISMRHGIIQRCFMHARYKFNSASAVVDIDDVAFLANTAAAPISTFCVYIEGVIDQFSMRGWKMEQIPYGIVVNNDDSNRYDLLISNMSCQNIAHALNFFGTAGRVTLLGKNSFRCSETGTYNVFENIDANVQVVSETFTSSSVGTVSLSGSIAGDGVIFNHFQKVLDKTAAYSIRMNEEGYIWTNDGAGAAVTFTLPDPPGDEGFRATFTVIEAFALRIEPGTKQIIGHTSAAGDRLSSATVGDSVTLVYVDGAWRVTAIAGAWASNILTGSATFNPADLVDGAGETTTVTVTGAALGDFVEGVSFSLDLQGITLTAWVSATNTVSVRFQNETTGSINLAEGTLRVRVRPFGTATWADIN
jgi:hypothetical protein